MTHPDIAAIARGLSPRMVSTLHLADDPRFKLDLRSMRALECRGLVYRHPGLRMMLVSHRGHEALDHLLSGKQA